jgi:hypothetical protein
MDFDKNKVYTALNADKLKIGSKCIFANNLDSLKCKVEEGKDIRPIVQILTDAWERRFKTNVAGEFPFAYLISESEPNWIVYLRRRTSNPENYYLTSCRSDVWEKVQNDYGAKTKLFEGTDDECDKWYESRKNLTDVIVAWEDGKHIQFRKNGEGEWVNVYNPSWDLENEYRIKPNLKWTDLKVGDVVRHEEMSWMVTGIDARSGTTQHIHFNNCWYYDFELEDWEKVEE